LTNAQDKVIAAESLDTTRTLVLSGRPLRLIPNDWIRSWEKDPMKVKEFCDKGMLGLLTHGAMDSHTLGYKRLRKAPPCSIKEFSQAEVGQVGQVDRPWRQG
jgi:NAD(P)H-dependent flavin oxidoreductase YrpB (nitropropane dioxygenase family)